MSTATKLAKMYGPSSKMQRVRADSLQPHPMAQRDLVPSRLKKLSADLDLDAIGVLHVVQYPIKNKLAMWIIDGQHRWRALIDHGFGEWEVEVKLHGDVIDDARASALFLKLNDRSPVSPFDKFQNRLRAKEDEAIAINDIVISHHMQIARQSGPGKLVGVTSLEEAYRLDEGKGLDKALSVISEAWGLRSVDSKVIKGIALVFAHYDGTIDQPALIKKLSKYPGGATGLVGDARGLMEYRKQPLTRCVADRVIETYNSGRRIEKLDPL
jgi:hypothetical protein